MPDTVCYEPDGTTPCRYQVRCHEARRRVMALTAPPFGPLRGMACWAYQMLEDRSRVAPVQPVAESELPAWAKDEATEAERSALREGA